MIRDASVMRMAANVSRGAHCCLICFVFDFAAAPYFWPPRLPAHSDHRLRGYFGDRYDARANLCDWDYHMRLKAVVSTRTQG